MKVDVLNLSSAFGNWLPNSLLCLIVLLNRTLDLVPGEYRDSAFVFFKGHPIYEDDAYVSISIGYERLETDEEVAARIKVGNDRETEIKRRELRELERLRAKYGNPVRDTIEQSVGKIENR